MGMDKLHGVSTEFSINSCMSTQYLLPKARNLVTGQTVKIQDLTGNRYPASQRAIAQERAEQLAKTMEGRTRNPWIGYVEIYEASKKQP